MLLIFNNVHETLTAEKVLKAESINHLVVPVPPYINEGCGLGIRIKPAVKELIIEVFANNQITVEKWIEE